MGWRSPEPDPPPPPRLHPDDIDLRFVPRHAFATELHELDDRLVVIKGDRGMPHQLNDSGAVAWRGFDGSISLGALADQIATASGAPLETVQLDLIELARTLAGSGLLAGVDPGIPSSPELDLVIGCARAWLHGRTGAELGTALTRWCAPGPRHRPPDWPVVIDLARGHRLSHALDAALGAPGGPPVPDQIRTDLSAHLAANAAHVQQLVTHLHVVVGRLTASGIRVLPFKGPVLARAQLIEPDRRECRDLDLLVARRDLPRAQRVLVEAGYVVAPGGPARSPIPGLARRGAHEIDLVDAGGSVTIDLHRGLAPPAFRVRVPFGDLWARRGWVELDGAPVPAPSIEDTVWLACIQTAKDAWERRLVLSKLVDLAAVVIRHPGVDLEAVLRRSRLLGTHGIVQFALTLTDEVLGPIPGLPHASRPDHPELARRIQEARRDLAQGGSPRGAPRRAQFHADLRERRRDRLGAGGGRQPGPDRRRP